ncbi:MAG: enoyl-CoA hydratase/isomerase family protein [Rhizobiaceae bacterium]|nr:enoyl-CoA hydratase/isomerase family protein [Rhizobiaceae bacterium]
MTVVSGDFGGADEIGFERQGRAGVVTLTRPKALNALTQRMVNALAAALDAWRNDPAVELVIVRAEGRAFCAGGDIVDVYKAGREGRLLVDFFADEYRLNAAIEAYPKPYVALIDGIVMGGGVGISAHGSHRVVTENAVFAMPEVGIGFFPDVGGSHFLPRLRGASGMYFGLTGNRARWGDQLHSGFATHAVKAEALDELARKLAAGGDIGAKLAEFAQAPEPETQAVHWQSIDRHFAQATLDGVMQSLDEADGEFEAGIAATIAKRSPTSVKVAFREIAEGRALAMSDCMNMEFRILNRMLAGRDFYEGIRAAVIDKDNAPAWQPATLDEVSDDAVSAYFAPLGEKELGL